MLATKLPRFATNHGLRQVAFQATSRRLMAKTPTMIPYPVTNHAATALSLQFRGFSASVEDRHHGSSMGFSTMAQNPGVLEKPLKVLDMTTVQKIKKELMEVDSNSDGRLDAEELKVLLKKHSGAFSDDEIYQISELFYASKAGESVRFDTFIEAIDRAAAASIRTVGNEKLLDGDSPVDHFRERSENNPLGVGNCAVEFLNMTKTHHGHYTPEELNVNLTHLEPKSFRDKLAYNSVKAVRFMFDAVTGWNGVITADKVLNRVIYLETIAAVPGMVAAIVRHLQSLRNMKPDGGYMQLFLEEANNERMHLLTFVRMKNPGMFFRAAVVGGQFGFGAAFMTAYTISPSFCHRFVGYVEEEACSTYTKIIQAIEEAPEGSDLVAWRTEPPPKIARAYWKLEGKTVLDLMYAVRADEAEHRDVNHLMCGVKEGQVNPLYDPEAKLNGMLTKYVKDMMTRGKD